MEDIAFIAAGGGIVIFQGRSEAGEEWLRDNVGEERFGERRYCEDIAFGAHSSGLAVSIDGRLVLSMEPA